MSRNETARSGFTELLPMQCERDSYTGFDLLTFRPENPTSNYPIVFASGYGTGPASYELFIRQLCKKGFTVICTEYQPQSKGQPKLLGIVPDVHKVKQQAIRTAVEKAGKKVHFVGHSIGCLEGVPILKDYAENIASCTLIAPRGVMPERSRWKAAKELWAGDIRNGETKKKLINSFPEAGVIFRNIREKEKKYHKYGLRYLAQLLAFAPQTIHHHFRDLRAKGAKIIIIAHTNDGYVPVEEYSNVLKEDDAPVDGFLVISGNYGGIHGTIKHDTLSCRAISGLIKKLDQAQT